MKNTFRCIIFFHLSKDDIEMYAKPKIIVKIHVNLCTDHFKQNDLIMKNCLLNPSFFQIYHKMFNAWYGLLLHKELISTSG